MLNWTARELSMLQDMMPSMHSLAYQLAAASFTPPVYIAMPDGQLSISMEAVQGTALLEGVTFMRSVPQQDELVVQVRDMYRTAHMTSTLQQLQICLL